MKSLLKNPEFQKNIWLEMSTQRLVLMPVIIFTLLFLASISPMYNDIDFSLSKICYVGFSIILSLWGGKIAHDNIVNEYNNRTWDWQKTSALSPGQLLTGKLFGAPIYSWYGALICLLLYWFLSLKSYDGNVFLYGITGVLEAIKTLSLVMIIALLKIRKGNGRDKIKGDFLFIVLLIYGFTNVVGSMGLDNFTMLRYLKGVNGTYEMAYIKFFGTIFYTAWALIGLYQSFRHELSYKNSAWIWYLFLITSSLYTGFTYYWYVSSHFLLFFFGSFTIHAIVFAYLMVIIESKEITQLMMLFKKLKEKNWLYLNYQAPLWLLTAPLIFIGLILTWIGINTSNTVSEIHDIIKSLSGMFSEVSEEKTSLIWPTLNYMLALAFFIIRDFALVLFLNVNVKKKRADGAFILYLFLLYVLAPLLGARTGASILFYPTLNDFGFVAPLIEALVLIFMLLNRLNTIAETKKHLPETQHTPFGQK
jgi:hypothetical protein